MRLKDKVAIVTGGSRGIGRAYAERFIQEGATVVVADASSAEGCVQSALDRHGRIDILVNNAAMYGDWDLTDQSEAYLHRVFDVNLHGVWLMTRAVAPAMVTQGGGRIVNQASAAAYNYVGMPAGEFAGLNAFNYQQTKWGVVGLTKFSAGQLGRYGITVNCIAPGVIATDATKKVVPMSTIESLAKLQAVPGVLEAVDLTGAAVSFATDEARFVTGQVLVIDGGKYMPA